MQQRDTIKENNITNLKWLGYAKQLYERAQDKDTPPIISSVTKLFSLDNVKEGIGKLAVGKAWDIDGLQEEHLRWGLEIFMPHIKIIFDGVI